MKKESKFQKELIDEIKNIFPGCMVLKNDSGYLQGIPDLTILYKKHWACLEVKRSANANHQPNQDYYINKINKMSFGRFIFPENKNQVLEELRKEFKTK